MVASAQLELPPIVTKSADAALAWKKVFYDLCVEYQQFEQTTAKNQSLNKLARKPQRIALQVPSSDALHLCDTDQLWQSLEFENKSTLSASKRWLHRFSQRNRILKSGVGSPHKIREGDNRGGGLKRVRQSTAESEGSSVLEDLEAGLSNNDLVTEDLPEKIEKPEYSNVKDLSPAKGIESASSSDQEEQDNKKALKRRRVIEALEEKNMAPKAWALRGEVTASSRPKNSLLDSTYEFDAAKKPDPFAIGDFNGAIENIIKQRVADMRFDDVALREMPVLAPSENFRTEGNDMDSEKSRKGLGELYADEFREKDKNRDELPVSAEAPSGKRKEVAELFTAFERIAQKLDVLSNFSVTPLMRDMAKTDGEAVPEDVVKDKAMITGIEAQADGIGGETNSKKGSSVRNHSKKRRRRKQAGA